MLLIQPLEPRQFFAAGPTVVFSYSNSGLNTVTFRSDTPGDRAVPVKTLVDSGGRAQVVAYAGGAVVDNDGNVPNAARTLGTIAIAGG